MAAPGLIMCLLLLVRYCKSQRDNFNFDVSDSIVLESRDALKLLQ